MPILGFSSSPFLVLLTFFVLIPLQLLGLTGLVDWVNDWLASSSIPLQLVGLTSLVDWINGWLVSF